MSCRKEKRKEEKLYSITEINQGENNMDYIMLIGFIVILIFAVAVKYGIGVNK